jgi:hypothetical protein
MNSSRANRAHPLPPMTLNAGGADLFGFRLEDFTLEPATTRIRHQGAGGGGEGSLNQGWPSPS